MYNANTTRNRVLDLASNNGKIYVQNWALYNRQSDIHDLYGGNRQSGIAASGKHSYIFLFNSPHGENFGYEDGWVSNDEFLYSGEGQRGDMDLARGNRAIYEHQNSGKQIHLFESKGRGSYEYLGQFEYVNHEIRPGRDVANYKRQMICVST